MGNVEVTSHAVQVKRATWEAMNRAALGVGGAVVGHATELCPVKTGNLKNSITFALDNPFSAEKITITVGTNVEYAPYVELGHNQQPGRFVPAIKKRLKASHVAARPFLRPAFDDNMDEINAIISSELSII